MYLNYFGLVEPPFSIAPDPQYLYMSARHREAMAHLSYGLSQGGCFIVLSGEVGTGKTTLCRNLMADLPEHVDVALILNPKINRRELLETVCDELKITYPDDCSKKQLLDSINEYLLKAYAENRHTVLIIDEAQLLSQSVLEQIRLLTNLETTKAKLLQIILVGQPELNDLLTRNDLRQLAQRVTARYHLPAIAKDEIQDYVNFRLGVAGCRKPLFSAQALRHLHQLSGGIPRKINVLADHALLATYAKSQLLVDSKTVKSSANDVFIDSVKSNGGKKIRNWVAGIAAAALLNFCLWWWFTSPNTQSVDSQLSQSESSKEALSSDVVMPEVGAAQKGDGVAGSQELINIADLSENEELLTEIAESRGVNPGSVVISEEFLDQDLEPDEVVDDLTSQQNFATDTLGEVALTENAANVEVVQKRITPAYLSGSAFGRVLEVSPDRTGRVAAFKNLAVAWDVDLTSGLLGPLCEELEARSVDCLPVSSWPAILRFNRPTIMVLEHKGQQHRVILFKLLDGVASVLVGEQSYELPVSELRDRWFNNAMVFWRPGAAGKQFLQQGDVSDGLPSVRLKLNSVLTKLKLPQLTELRSTTFDADLSSKARLLQERFDILSDGKIGSETYLLMNELLNPEEVPVLFPRPI